MFNLLCDKCDSLLILNYSATMDNYLSKVDYLKDPIDVITAIALETDLHYTCSVCSNKCTYTVTSSVAKFKQQLIFDIQNFKKIHIFKNYINPTIINPDNGLIFCGKCTGIDNNGNCYVDITKQCPYKEGTNEL